MQLGIKNFIGGATGTLFGNGTYSQNIVQGGSVLQPDANGTITITGAATVVPDAFTGAAVVTCKNLVLDGAAATLTPTVQCKGLYVYASGQIQYINGAKSDVSYSGLEGDFGQVNPHDLIPAALRGRFSKTLLAPYTLLGGAEGGAGYSTTGATTNGNPGQAAAAFKTGGGGGGAARAGGGTSTSGSGGIGGTFCGGAGGGSTCATIVISAGDAEDFGGTAGIPANSAAYPVGGSAGNPASAGLSGGTIGTTKAPGVLMLFSPYMSIAAGCILSSDGGIGGNGYASGAGQAGGLIAVVTHVGGLSNLGTIRTNGGAGGIATYDGNSKGGSGGAGSVNICTVTIGTK